MRTVVITGANTGLGFETALALARTGARIVMACRNMEKAREAEGELLAEVPNASTVVLPLDVAEPESVREFARQFSDRVGSLDILINNAGVVGIPLARNSVGHEMQLATNYLGAFALTGAMLPLFRRDVPSRIVNVGSLATRVAGLDLDDLNFERTPYGELRAYARSKMAMLSFSMELSRRLQRHGGGVIAVGAHPGFAATDIRRNSTKLSPTDPISNFLIKAVTPLIASPAQAAGPIIHAASHEDAAGGDYYGPAGFLEIWGRPGAARVNPLARDLATGSRLWALSESMTGVRYLSEAAEDAASPIRASRRAAE